MKILIKPKKKLIACIALGAEYKTLWKNNILPTWKLYCKKNNIGLVLFESDLVEKKKLILEKSNLATIIGWGSS